MAITRTNRTNSTKAGGATSVNCAYTGALTAGSVLVVGAVAYDEGDNGLTTPTATGFTFLPFTAEFSSPTQSHVRGRLWYALNSGTTTPTVTFSGANYWCVFVAEYTGVDTANPIDVTAVGSTGAGSGASPTACAAGSITPVTNGAMLVSFVSGNYDSNSNLSSVTVPTGFSSIFTSTTWVDDMWGGFADMLQATAGAINPTWSVGKPNTNDLRWIAATGVLRPAGGAAIDLVVADLTVATTIDAPTLTVESVLAVGDLTVAATIDAPTLTQVHQLAVADLTVTVAVDTVTLSTAAYPYPAAVSGRALVDQHGVPIFPIGDTCWSLAVQATPTEATDYFDVLASYDVTSVLFSYAEHLFSDNSPAWRNKNGDLPFTGTAWSSSFTDAYMDHVEFLVSEMFERGITAWICVPYLGFSGTEEGWDTEVVAASNADMTARGNELAARFASYPNIVWVIGHDKDPSATEEARCAALADAIQAGTSHLVTVGGVEQLGSAAWSGSGVDYDFDTVYFRNDNEAALHTQAGWSAGTIPTGFFEGRYENDGPDATTLRSLMYGPLCGGAAYVFFGNNPVWRGGSGAGGWSAAAAQLTSPGYQSLAGFASVVGALGDSWATMVPDTTDTFLTSGEGTGATRAAARFDGSGTSGILALAWRPEGGSSSLTFDLTELAAGAVTISKVDPVSGTTTAIGTYSTSGSQAVGSLGTNSAGDTDWLLVFEAVDVVDLVVSDLVVTTVIDSPALTQNHMLVVADLAVTTVIDTPTLTQAHSLAVADLAVAAVIDAPTLSQTHALAVGDLVVASTIDTVTLTVGAIALTVEDVAVETTIDAVALTQVHVLVVADLTVAATIDLVHLSVPGEGPIDFDDVGLDVSATPVIDLAGEGARTLSVAGSGARSVGLTSEGITLTLAASSTPVLGLALSGGAVVGLEGSQVELTLTGDDLDLGLE